MKKYGLELLMACLLLVSFLILSKQAAQVAGTMATTDNSKTILVDAGHGGADPGMIGVGGLEEKGINLQIAMKLREILEKKGFTVIMTREEDKGLYDEESRNQKAQDMQRRIVLVKECKPVLCISIHQNSYQDEQIRGAQVFYYSHSEEGKRMAEQMQKALLTVDETNTRQAKANDTYYLLKRTEVPTIIVECGFLSNPEEAAKLTDTKYQKKMADAITKGIIACVEN